MISTYFTVLNLYSLLSFKLVYADNQAQNLLTDSKDNSPNCSCYLVSGPDPGYFQYHRFWDFRNIPSTGVSGDYYQQTPPLITNQQTSGNESITSSYFNSANWTRDWAIQIGPEETGSSPVNTIQSPQNVYISVNTTAGAESQTFLTLRTNRLKDFQSIAEIDSNQQNLLYASIRARLRLIPNSLQNNSMSRSTNGKNNNVVDGGACAGFFTYLSDTQESDIEILTNDPTSNVRFSNQPDYDAKTDESVPGASSNVSMPNGDVWTEWLNYRIDWFQGMSRWYVDDQLLLNKTKNVPTKPSGLIINLWSDGGYWTGNMSLGNAVVLGVEWIDMVFNISGNILGPSAGKRDVSSDVGKRAASMCSVGCYVDGPGVQQVGFPVLAFNSTSKSGAQRLTTASSFVFVETTLLTMVLVWIFEVYA